LTKQLLGFNLPNPPGNSNTDRGNWFCVGKLADSRNVTEKC